RSAARRQAAWRARRRYDAAGAGSGQARDDKETMRATSIRLDLNHDREMITRYGREAVLKNLHVDDLVLHRWRDDDMIDQLAEAVAPVAVEGILLRVGQGLGGEDQTVLGRADEVHDGVPAAAVLFVLVHSERIVHVA